MATPSFYPLASDSWGIEEQEAISRVLHSKKFTMGQEVKNFEDKICKMFGFEYAVMVNSGSSANLVMLTATKILFGSNWPEKPEIIVPAVSWSTTFTPLYYLGLRPVFVDVDEITFGLSAEKVQQAMTPNTVAILAVNVLGQPCDLDGLRRLAEEKNVILLEDNCESLGAVLGEKFTGTFGLASSHSSFFSHHISTMEGGWICTNSKDFYMTCLSLRAHGWVREQPEDSPYREEITDGMTSLFHFVLPGLNFRPLELEAAIGIEQLGKLKSMNEFRVRNLELFRSLFSQSKNVKLQGGPGRSTSFALPLILTGELLGERQRVADSLIEQGIECRPIIAGNFTRQPVVRYLSNDPIPPLPNADEIHFNGLYLGNHGRDLTNEIHHAWKALSKVELEIIGKEN